MSVRETLKRDLKQAMKERNKASASTIKSALAAIDNAEAVPIEDTDPSAPLGTAGLARDVPRRDLTDADIAAILHAEAEELRTALAEYESYGRTDNAEEMRAALRVLARYVDVEAPRH